MCWPYRMTGAGTTVNILSGSGKNSADSPQGLDGLSGLIGSDLAAVAKALTGAYLSSSGNAFSTRTASFIVQDHFAPGIAQTAGGRCSAQFASQLPCGDLVQRGAGIGIGPKRSPLGLAADPAASRCIKTAAWLAAWASSRTACTASIPRRPPAVRTSMNASPCRHKPASQRRTASARTASPLAA
jgi:hypothetical protein